jgi:hypothetical protein
MNHMRITARRIIPPVAMATGVGLLLVGMGIPFRGTDAAGVDFEALAQETARCLLWVFMGLVATLPIALLLITGPGAGRLCISTGILVSALQVGSRLCFTWHTASATLLFDVKHGVPSMVPHPPCAASLIEPYLWIVMPCAAVAFCCFVAALYVVPDLWTSARNRIGMILWIIGVLLAIIHIVPLMRFIILWHA